MEERKGNAVKQPVSVLPPATGRHASPKGLSWLSSYLVLELAPGHCGEEIELLVWTLLSGSGRPAASGSQEDATARHLPGGGLEVQGHSAWSVSSGARPSIGWDLVTARHRHLD